MSGSPEMLFPDDGDMDSPLPGRPLLSPQPIGKKSSAVAPSDRKLGFFPAGPGRAEHVAIRVAPPPGPPPAQRFKPSPAIGPPPIPAFYDPTGRKLLTSPSAFRINPDSVVKAPLRRTKKAGRRRHNKGKLTRHKARAYRSRKVSRPSTRASLRR